MAELIRGLKKLRVEDNDLNQLQDNVDDALTPLINNPLLNGILLEGVELIGAGAGSTIDNVIEHKLGRKLRGWIITRLVGNQARIHDRQDFNPIPDKTLVLWAQANVTVSIYVF